ncbi:30S ribosomal protein S20 [Patescibacteria group bacterium]|nr:30S ribosomal protein S20 [Patescibacteria group bacterium]
MPIIKSAKKRVRSSARRRSRNLVTKSTYRTAVKKAATDKSPESLKVAYKALDKATKKGVIPKNRAARLKSQLSRAVKKTA